ncbi:MAG: HAMP domain-containing protein [Candidatus Dadabacteria bacterium]|nr:MAG: HAMP domain-containing protein [Candidatus Dadabacteria bacterium]
MELFDARKRPVFAPPDRKAPERLVPVVHGGRPVGYLAAVPLRELTDAADLLFVQRQTRAFALISLVAAGFSLLLSFPLANHLLRPIRSLSAATRELASGRYGTRVPPGPADELGRLCADFNELARTLEANETARRQWVADIAHELRTPLAVLRGEIEAMQDGIRTPDAAGLGGLHGEVLRLARLVDDLYELSLSDLGALTYRKRPVDVVGLLAETLERFGPRLEAAGLALETRLPGAPVPLTADPDRLGQLFENLLENSLRYTAAPGRVRVGAEAGPDRVEIVVEDSAPGVEEEQRDRLFERLYRGEASRNRATGGAGLGLTICKNIVEAHGGTIEAAPSALGGLAIRVRLPRERRAGA